MNFEKFAELWMFVLIVNYKKNQIKVYRRESSTENICFIPFWLYFTLTDNLTSLLAIQFDCKRKCFWLNAYDTLRLCKRERKEKEKMREEVREKIRVWCRNNTKISLIQIINIFNPKQKY